MEGIHGEEAEKQYHSVAVFTLGVENASKRLRQHVLGKKLMSKDELKESLQEMEEMMQACRIHTVHNFVSLDSDAIARIDEEVNELIRETYGEVSDEEESDGGKTSSPPASLKSKKKGTSKGKPKGKGKSSTSNGQVSGVISCAMLLFIHIHAILTHFPPSSWTFPIVFSKKGSPRIPSRTK